MQWCDKCRDYILYNRPHKCRLVHYSVSYDTSYVPNVGDYSEGWFSEEGRMLAELLAEKYFNEDPGELDDIFVFIREKSGIVSKFIVTLTPTIRYRARKVGYSSAP